MTTLKEDFILKIFNCSKESYKTWKILPSITISQSCLESGFGKHDMGVNNLFGFKGSGPAGSIVLPTKEWDNNTQKFITIDQKFRAYNSVCESVFDHDRLLATKIYYKNARKYMNDPLNFIKQLTGVYATDPNYDKKLLNIINHFNLLEYDKKL